MTGIMRRCREKKMIKNDRICLHPGPRRALVSYSYFQLHSFLSEFYPWFLSIDNSLVIAEVYFNPKENLKKEEGGGKEGKNRGSSEMVIRGEAERRRRLVGILEFYSIRSPLLVSRTSSKKGDLAAEIISPFRFVKYFNGMSKHNGVERGKKVGNLLTYSNLLILNNDDSKFLCLRGNKFYTQDKLSWNEGIKFKVRKGRRLVLREGKRFGRNENL